MPDLGVQVIPTGVYGPLPQGTVGLILGKSSATIRGLQVYYPGVIDEDCTAEIKIMAQAPDAFVPVFRENKIAQLLILPNVKKGKVLAHTLWRDRGFGSSDHPDWVPQVTEDNLEVTLYLNDR
jgi:dUTPase